MVNKTLFFLIAWMVSSALSLAHNPNNDNQAGVVLKQADELNHQGERYHFGQGVKQDYQKARALYLQAVQLGSAQAANHLGRLYTNGEGVPKNTEEAQKWYVKSVELDPSLGNRCMNGLHPNRLLCAVVIPAMGGTPSAQYELGRLYERGVPDLELDVRQAFTFYRKAAEQHYAPAALALARCYRDGIGVAKDAPAAEEWEKKGWALEKQGD